MTFASFPSLRDRVVLVTGGASGIGAEEVLQFVQQGSKVAFVDTDVDGSERLVEKCRREKNGPPLYLPCDLRDVAALQAAVATVADSSGPICVLVNNSASDERHD